MIMSWLFVAFYHIHYLRRIRIYLNKATAIPPANALVSTVILFWSVVPKNIKQVCIVYRITLPEWRGQVGFQSLGPCSNHCIGCILNHVPNSNWAFWHIKYYSWVLPHISVICCISRIANKHWDPKLWSYTAVKKKLRPFIVRAFFVPHLWNKLSLEIREVKSVTIFRKEKKHTFLH